jgi:multidrug efflux system membrane fusion protein
MKPVVFDLSPKGKNKYAVARLWQYIILSVLVFPGVLYADELDATLLWGNKLPLGTPVSGVVKTVSVVAGDFAKQGSVLLSLDDGVFRANLTARSAELKGAENDRNEAVRELGRTQELYDRTLISEHEREMVVIQRDAAIAKYQTAQAALAKAEWELEHTQVKAPFDAWVLSRDVAVGQTIVSRLQSTPLLELVEAGVMLARTQVPAGRLSNLNKGGKAIVTVDGKQYPGKIERIALQASTVKPSVDSVHYAVDVVFDSGPTLLRAGLSAKVKF